MKPHWLPDQELVAVIVFAALAGAGSWLRSTSLSLFGVLGALYVGGLFVWQRWCLIGLTYRRDLSVSRAQFNEEVEIQIELINDKILPLPWVRVQDEVPPNLGIADAAPQVVDAPTITDESAFLVMSQMFSMFPFQRTRRSVTFNCRHRGRHRFGSSVVSSGDPLGLRSRQTLIERQQELIVYPKMFVLEPTAFDSLAPIGDDRSSKWLISDPTRIAGTRPYRVGDPLRHVDWRTTARRSELLVRDFEATTTLRATIFLDLADTMGDEASASVLEFRIAVAATIVSSLALRNRPVGLFATGTVDGEPVGHDPSSAPGALQAMLESLALCAADPSGSFPQLLARESSRVRSGSIVFVIASEFTESTLLVLADYRRRALVAAIFVDAGHALAPDRGLVDRCYNAAFQDQWRDQSSLHFTA